MRLFFSDLGKQKWFQVFCRALPGVFMWWCFLGYILGGLSRSAPVVLSALVVGTFLAGALSARGFADFDLSKFLEPLKTTPHNTLLLAGILLVVLIALSNTLPTPTFPATHSLAICAPEEAATGPFIIHAVERTDGGLLSLLEMQQDEPWNSVDTGLQAQARGACARHSEFFEGGLTVLLREGPGSGSTRIEWDGRIQNVDLNAVEEGVRRIELSGDHPVSATLLRQVLAVMMRFALFSTVLGAALGLALAFMGGRWGTGALRGDNVWLALGLVALVGLLTSGVLGRSAALVSDDFCYSSAAVQSGWLDGTLQFYTTANGRLLGNSLGVLSGVLSPFSPLPLAVLAILGLLVAGLVPLISRALRWLTGKDMHALAWTLSAMVVLVTLINTPDIYQSLFWRSGRQPLLFPLMLLPLLIALLLDFSKPVSNVRPGWRMVSILLLSTFTGLFHEAYAAAQVSMLLVAIVLVWLNSRGKRKPPSLALPALFAAFLGALAGLLVQILSPGTAERSAELGSTFRPLGIAYGALYDSVVLLFAENLNILTIGLFALGAILVIRFSKPSRFTGLQTSAAWLAVPLILWAGVLASMAVGHYGIGKMIPERTQVIPTFLATLSALLWGMLSGVEILRRGPKLPPKLIKTVQIVAVVVFGTAFVFHGYIMIRQQEGFDHYRKAVNVMIDTIQAAEATGANHVVVPRLPENLFGVVNPETEEANFVNRCVNQLFGIEVAFD